MKLIVPSLLIALSAVACNNATSMEIKSPDGQDYIGIECKRGALFCMQEAGIQCPNGYDVQGSDGHFYAVSSGSASVGAWGGYAHASSGEAYHGEWVIKCHGQSKADIEAEKSEAAHQNDESSIIDHIQR